ncbi:MAG: hypothetical protein KAU21_05985 [Gammaproteobacteria bacterium]|nr:hypothetical protein [Gammaproteobacteria bacterium]
MNLKNKIAVLLIPLFLLACASTQKRQPEVKEIFVTNIKEDGVKLFSYSVTMSTPKKGKGRRGDGGKGRGKHGKMGAGNPDRESMMNENRGKITEKLDSRLLETGYCREGYIELNRYMGTGQSQIRGECKEKATDSDRKIFINTENT